MAAKFGFIVAAVALVCILHGNSANGEGIGSYILRFKDPTKSDVRRIFSTDVKSFDMNITHEYKYIFPGVSVNMTELVEKKVAAMEGFEIIADTIVQASCKPQPKVPSWGLDRIDQRNLPLDDVELMYQGDGTGVHIYIVDTGILKSHDEFGDRVQDGFSSIGLDPNKDCQGHGTHVAGTAAGSNYGVAKNAILHSVQVLGCDGKGYIRDTIAGLDWIAEHAPALKGSRAVASMSLGGPINSAMDEAVDSLIRSGVVVVTAAGNENQDACNISPARVQDAITVGASTISDTLADFSNFGLCVNITAPGNEIKSAGKNSDTEIVSKSGTSMACPHVSGAAAILIGLHPEWNPLEVWDEIKRLSSKNKLQGNIRNTPNRLLFINDA